MMEAAAPSTPAPGGGGDANNSADEKVLTDLQTLSEQIDLCVEMLRQQDIPPGRPVDQATSDEALLGVVGFLEACAPRMVDLVEAAAQGALLEGTLMKCLEVNDRLLKVLSDCDGKGGEGGSAGGEGAGGSAAAPPAAAAKAKSDIDLDDLLLDDTPSSPEAGGGYKQSTKLGAGRFDAASTGAAKGGDPFGASTDLLVPTPADGGGKKPAASASDFTIDDGDDAGDGGGGKKDGEDDDFDAFFKERTS